MTARSPLIWYRPRGPTWFVGIASFLLAAGAAMSVDLYQSCRHMAGRPSHLAIDCL